MAHIIEDILQIMPATGWVFKEPKGSTSCLADYMPVVMFALVQTRDDDVPDSDSEKRVIPIDHYEIETLIGDDAEDAEEMYRTIVNISQINAAGVYRADEIAEQSSLETA